MSWLVVAFIPGLLMLATSGLQRLESSLEHDALSVTDVAEFLDRAEPADVCVLARDGMPEALDCLHRRIADESHYLPSSAEWATDQLRAAALVAAAELVDRAGQPDDHSQTNRQFDPRQHANRV